MFPTHREGYKIIPVSLFILAGIVIAGFFIHQILGAILLIGAIVLGLIIVNFFRNPSIDVKDNPQHILSPCDGKVVVIEEVEDDLFFNGPVTQISIYMSAFNVHVNRNPVGGRIDMLKYFPGKYLLAFNPKSSTENEQNYIVATNDKVSVAYKQIAGFMARRIICYIKEGEIVKQGNEYGFIRFGSRIDVLFPPHVKVNVKLQDKVKAGISVLAEIEE